jgi:anti-sigma regulatory factor (Ser/Thr protein kinase)
VDARSEVARALAALDAFCAREPLSHDTEWRLRVALDEIVANIATHGARHGQPPRVELAFRRDGDRIEVVVTDDGHAFNPLAAPEPDLSASLEHRTPGGVGIKLLKSLIEDVRYERTDRNILTLRTRR